MKLQQLTMLFTLIASSAVFAAGMSRDQAAHAMFVSIVQLEKSGEGRAVRMLREKAEMSELEAKAMVAHAKDFVSSFKAAEERRREKLCLFASKHELTLEEFVDTMEVSRADSTNIRRQKVEQIQYLMNREESSVKFMGLIDEIQSEGSVVVASSYDALRASGADVEDVIARVCVGLDSNPTRVIKSGVDG